MCFINLFMVILETRLMLSKAKLNIKWLLSDDRRRCTKPLIQWRLMYNAHNVAVKEKREGNCCSQSATSCRRSFYYGNTRKSLVKNWFFLLEGLQKKAKNYSSFLTFDFDNQRLNLIFNWTFYERKFDFESG